MSRIGFSVMTVFVDEPIWKLKGMLMCHMMADTLEELHEMADKIGMKREWFQDNISHPHYDLSKSKRELAIRLGAVELNNYDMVRFVREKRRRVGGI